ncbi:hypothetical protein BX666DRAFT_1497197 [Dichotomocladium elegans]|nr:hypothetical protein BX666DRAFT_1497197 [Dichotomocladium elegans]
MPAPELPPEVILHICSWLPPNRRWLLPLLTVNRHWHRVIVSELYTTVSIRSLADQYHYRNLFRETRRARQHQHDAHFYSTTDYAGYVRCVDMSFPYPGKAISDEVLLDLVRDCTHLERLNIYNCHLISTRGLLAVLEQCPRLRHLHCAMATGLTAKAFEYSGRELLTLNIHGLSTAHVFRRGRRTLPPSLTRLSATGWLPLTMHLPHLRQLRLDGLQQQTMPGALWLAFPHLDHLSLKQASIVDAFPYTRLDTLELTRCSVAPSVPAIVATHLHLAHTPVGHPRTWIHPRLVSLTTPPNTSPEDLEHLIITVSEDNHLSKSNSSTSSHCRLRHLTIVDSPGLAHTGIPPAMLKGLVSLDTEIDPMSHFPPEPCRQLTDLRMRAHTCRWSMDMIPEVFPSLRILFWSPSVDPSLIAHIDRLGDLCALMILPLYYREPTARLVMLRETYQHVDLAKDIW